MNKVIIRFFALTLFASPVVLGMEKKPEKHYKKVNFLKKFEANNVFCTENNNTLVALENNVSSIALQVYDLITKEKIHSFSSSKHTFFDYNYSSIVFLLKKKAKSRPVCTYNLKTKKLKSLKYDLKKDESAFNAATNAKTDTYKALLIRNDSSKKYKALLFDKKNNIHSKITLDFITGTDWSEIDLSPSGKRLIVFADKHPKQQYFIINVKNHAIINTITTDSYCKFHELYDIFCDGEIVYDKNGKIIAQSFNDPIIGYTKKQLATYNQQNNTIQIYKIKGSQLKLVKKLALPKDYPADGLAVSFMNYEKHDELRKKIVVYNHYGEDKRTLYFKND